MTVVIPASITAQGNVKVAFVPAIASVAAPTVAELTATGAVDISCYLMPDWGGITADQAKGSDSRFCSTQSFERLGRITRSVADIAYTYLPQTVGTDVANNAYTKLTPGANGYLVVRYGKGAGVAFTVGDKVDILPVTLGAQTKAVSGSDEFAPLTVTQGIGATGVLQQDAVVA